MLTTDNLLRDLIIAKHVNSKYGIESEKLEKVLKEISTYYWINNNASTCLTDCQEQQLAKILLTYNGCLSSDCAEFDGASVYPGDALSSVVATCLTTFELESYLSGANIVAGEWTEGKASGGSTYTSQGGTITQPNGGVDFTSIAPGTYTFIKTTPIGATACEDTGVVSLIVIKSAVPLPSNDDCSGAVTVPYIDITDPSSLTNQSNDRNCPTVDYPTVSGLIYPGSWQNPSVGDLWYKFVTDGAAGTLYAWVTPGTMTNAQIAVYKAATAGGSCEGLTLVGQAAATGSSIAQTSLFGLSNNYTYYIRVTSGGTNSHGTFSVNIGSSPVV